jgi:polyhydroxybutyrate depolymerase
MFARSTLVTSLLIFASPSCQRQNPDPKPVAAAKSQTVTAPPLASVAPADRLEAELHVPPQLATGQKAPLLIILHGLGSSAADIESSSDWPSFAAQHDIAWAIPNGPRDRNGRRFWSAGPSCCNFDASPVDHVTALAELVQRLVATAPIDAGRVFVGGHSNGGFMAHRFACERPELVRGIVSVAGAGPLDRSACKNPSSSLRVLEIHGDADPIVTYDGGHLFKNPSLPEHASARRTVADWAAALGCRSTPVASAALDVESHLAGAETRTESYPGCKSGRVELWTVGGGSHNVGFRSPAPAAIWQFLNR